MNEKILAYALAVSGSALIFYGISRFSNQSNKSAEIASSPTHALVSDKSSIGLGVTSAKQDVEQGAKQDVEQDLVNLEISKSPLAQRYNEIQRCINLDTTTDSNLDTTTIDTKGCLGFEASSYREYRENLLTNFKIELSLHVKNLKANKNLLVYDDELLARKILQTDDRADIQRLGLELLSLFPANEENLSVLENAMATTDDLDFLKRGFVVFKDYQNLPTFDESLDLVIQDQIRLGTNQEITAIASEALMSFMTENRFNHYQAFYSELEKLELKSNHSQQAHTRVLKNKMRALASVLGKYKTTTN